MNETNKHKLDYLDYTNLLEQANNLNRNKTKLNSTDLSSLTDYERNQSYFCQTIFKSISTLPENVQVFLKQIKPILFGKILFAPNTTDHVNSIIKSSNSTFKNIENFSNLISKIADLSENINSKYSSNDIKFLQEILGFKVENSLQKLKYFKNILYFIRNSIECFELDKFIGYRTEEEAIKAGIELMEKESFWSLIVFEEAKTHLNSSSHLPQIINYKIRMNASKTQDTAYTKDNFYNYGPSNCLTCNPYFSHGFIYIQDMLEKGIIEFKTNKSQDFGVLAQMTPYPCYIQDKFLLDISKCLPLFMVISWIYTVSTLVKDIVYEKEKRLKEFMQIMGLSNWVYWLSWFISAFSVMFFVSILICCIMKIGNITIYSDLSLLIALFTCFSIATVTQCFLLSVLFDKASLASVVAGISYFVLFLPYIALINYSETLLPWQMFLVSLSSTVAFSYGAEIMSTFELQAKGVKWSKINSSPFLSKFSVGTMCLILLLDAFIYMFLTWYIQELYPGEFGVARKWYFPFQKSFWFKECQNENVEKKNSIFCKFFKKSKKVVESVNFEFKTIEAVDSTKISETIGIEIKNLHKIYSRGNNHALKGLTVNFYQNEISAFLGHNGAGKSTTLHLLTGLYKPTLGEALINGLDIKTSMNEIRKSLGFVPQHNILFSQLTVKEHLIFYAQLKGLKKKSCLDEVNKLLEETELSIHKDKYAKSLSGGMQRKLSIAIALIGGSKTVILDEPTAGVDVGGRRGVWDLLLKYKEGRTLLISTHHLDEAEILSDRVAIISSGQLIAFGSPYFLKNKFTNGYYLTIAKKSLEFKDNLIDEFVRSKIDKAILIEQNCSELTFSIPNTEEYTSSYERVFNEIEERMTELGIDSIGLSDTSLEEIFIKLVKEPIKTQIEKPLSLIKKLKDYFIKDKEIVSETLTEDQLRLYSSYTNERVENNFYLMYQQMYALIIKRFHRVKRNLKGFLSETVLPVVFVCLALLVANFAPQIRDKPALELHPWYSNSQNQIFLSRNLSNNSNSSSVERVWKTFFESPGPGNRCLKEHKIMLPRSDNDFERPKHSTVLKCNSYNSKLIKNNLKPSNISCDCSTGFQKCSDKIQVKNVYKLKTDDLMSDLTNQNVSDWLVKTEFAEDMFEKRHGGLEFISPDFKTIKFLNNWKLFSKSSLNFVNLLSKIVSINKTEIVNSSNQYQLFASKNIKLWYNTKGYHSNVAYLNILNNALLRSNLADNKHAIVSVNHPMKFSRAQYMNELDKRIIIDLFVAIFIIFALSFIPASFLVFLVEERENNCKQLQFVSGVRPWIYWLSNFAWDLFNYILPAIICILIFLIFDTKTFTSSENFPCLISLIFLYGWSCVPLMYPLSYLFKLSGTSFVISSSLNIFIGVGTTTTTSVLNVLVKGKSNLPEINKVLKNIFICIFPHYCLGQGLLDMSLLYNTAEVKRNFGYKVHYSPFDFDKVGKNLLAMAIQGFVYFSINLLIQYKFFIRNNRHQSVKEDKNDLSHEETSYLKLVNLTKIYKRFLGKKNSWQLIQFLLGLKEENVLAF